MWGKFLTEWVKLQYFFSLGHQHFGHKVWCDWPFYSRNYRVFFLIILPSFPYRAQIKMSAALKRTRRWHGFLYVCTDGAGNNYIGLAIVCSHYTKHTRYESTIWKPSTIRDAAVIFYHILRSAVFSPSTVGQVEDHSETPVSRVSRFSGNIQDVAYFPFPAIHRH